MHYFHFHFMLIFQEETHFMSYLFDWRDGLTSVPVVEQLCAVSSVRNVEVKCHTRDSRFHWAQRCGHSVDGGGLSHLKTRQTGYASVAPSLMSWVECHTSATSQAKSVIEICTTTTAAVWISCGKVWLITWRWPLKL